MSTAVADHRGFTAAEVESVREALVGATKFSGRSAIDIARATGISTRWVRRILRELNFLGTPVVGYPDKGFWIASNVQDIHDYATWLRNQSTALESRADQVEHLGDTLRAELNLRQFRSR